MTEDPLYRQMKDRALHLMARRDHSISELRSKLRQKLRQEFNGDIFTQVVASLQSVGYLLKEEELALRWVAGWRKEGRGRRWISGKLRSKGLPSVNLDDDEDEQAAAEIFLAKKSSVKDKAKLGRAMVSRGFSHGLVATLMRKREKEIDHDESI